MHNVIVPPHYPVEANSTIIFLYGGMSWQPVAVDKIRALSSDVWIAAPGLRQYPVCVGWRDAYRNSPACVESWISGMEYSLLCQAAVKGVVSAWFSNLEEVYDFGRRVLSLENSAHLLVGVESVVSATARHFLRGVGVSSVFASLDDLCFASVDFIRNIKSREEQNLTWA